MKRVQVQKQKTKSVRDYDAPVNPVTGKEMKF